MRVGFILHDCLFSYHTLLQSDSYCMIEEKEFFQFDNKQKIVLQLSAMREHKKKVKNITYFSINDSRTFEEKLKEACDGADELVTYFIEDTAIRKRLRIFCKENAIKLRIVKSPKFTTTVLKFREYTRKYTPELEHFYIWQRKRLKLLVKDAKPLGGSWKFAHTAKRDLISKSTPSKITLDAIKDVESLFPKNPGMTKKFEYPTTTEQIDKYLDIFFLHMEKYTIHSHLSPYLNIGLITPKEIIVRAMKKPIPLEHFEPFLFNLLGKREYYRGIFQTQKLNLPTKNSLKLPSVWFSAKTNIPYIDNLLKKVYILGYATNKERWLLFQMLTLLQVHPFFIGYWFSTQFIDGAKWMAFPQVYRTFEMDNSVQICAKYEFAKGDWCDIWDGLLLLQGDSIYFQRMSSVKKEKLFKISKSYLKYD